MSENLLCPGQRIMTNEGKDNYDRIFSKERSFLGDELMRKGKQSKWVSLEDVVGYERKGWRRVE